MGTRQVASAYDFSSRDKLIVDTNVWFFIESTEAVKNDPGYTGLLYDTIIPSGANLYTSPLIVEEFINAYVRIAWKAYLKSERLSEAICKFKTGYRTTRDFEINYQTALKSAYENIVQLCTIVPTSETVLENSLTNTQAKDFNDELIIRTAEEHGLKILSDDEDINKFNKEVDFITLPKKNRAKRF